jgi:tetratricopeptide (TPR) repeat protein
MGTDDRLDLARARYEQAVYGGGTGPLTEVERGLDAVEADVALARGRILHARFLSDPASAETGSPDAAELSLFERALGLYRAAGDTRGEAEALFWVGCVHQVIRRDHERAVPYFEQAGELAARAGDQATQAEALRHLGIAAHAAGRLGEARDRLEDSSRLRRVAGPLAGVASNMIGLAYIAAAQDRGADALAILAEAEAIAGAQEAHAIMRHIEQARTRI